MYNRAVELSIQSRFDRVAEMEPDDAHNVVAEVLVLDVRVVREVTLGTRSSEGFRHPRLVVRESDGTERRPEVVVESGGEFSYFLHLVERTSIEVVDGSLVLDVPQV